MIVKSYYITGQVTCFSFFVKLRGHMTGLSTGLFTRSAVWSLVFMPVLGQHGGLNDSVSGAEQFVLGRLAYCSVFTPVEIFKITYLMFAYMERPF